MVRFQSELGVKCDHCHVPNEWEKDDRAAKQTARKMILMVRAINRDHLAGKTEVSCRICHGGKPKPEAP